METSSNNYTPIDLNTHQSNHMVLKVIIGISILLIAGILSYLALNTNVRKESEFNTAPNPNIQEETLEVSPTSASGFGNINVDEQFASANNINRRSGLLQILNGVGAYQADHQGVLPPGIDATVKTVASSGSNTVDLCLLVPSYLPDIPIDPSLTKDTDQRPYCNSGSYNSGYTIVATNDGARVKITLTAPAAELVEDISVSR